MKVEICVSPRTVRAYWPEKPGRQGPRRSSSQHWQIFVYNHAQAIVASDFLVAITARFPILCVLLIMEIGSRRILHCNVTHILLRSGLYSSFERPFPVTIRTDS